MEVAASDVPYKIELMYEENSSKLIVLFYYGTSRESQQKEVSDGSVIFHGKKSGRFFKIEIPDDKTKNYPLCFNNLFTSLPKGRDRKTRNFRFAKTLMNAVFKDTDGFLENKALT